MPGRPQPPPHILRPLTEADHPFVLKSWLRASRKAPEFRGYPTDTYFRHFHQVASRLLASRGVEAWGAAWADQPEKLYAFAVAEPGPPQVLHSVYTASWCRRWGFATLAARACGLDLDKPLGFTFPTPLTPQLLRRWVDGDGQPLAAYVGAAALWRYEAA